MKDTVHKKCSLVFKLIKTPMKKVLMSSSICEVDEELDTEQNTVQEYLRNLGTYCARRHEDSEYSLRKEVLQAFFGLCLLRGVLNKFVGDIRKICLSKNYRTTMQVRLVWIELMKCSMHTLLRQHTEDYHLLYFATRWTLWYSMHTPSAWASEGFFSSGGNRGFFQKGPKWLKFYLPPRN